VTFWILLFAGWAVMAGVMAALWLWQRARGDSGVVDVAWGLGVGILASVGCVFSPEGDTARRALIAGLALAWSLRLSGHIVNRLMRMTEDGRYRSLKSEWGDAAQRRMFWFYQVQAFWSVLFAIPMLIGARNPAPLFSPCDIAGLLIWILGVGGEAVADRQLARFRRQPSNRGKVCRDGLWYFSRHPNYFFEWLHWWAWVCLAWPAPAWWVTLLGPTLMLLFLFKVTGIPPTEAQALRSRGEAYREYQRTTSVFFPWPPRKGSAS
jgi:steroid 5-alpha reductase family enzyme